MQQAEQPLLLDALVISAFIMLHVAVYIGERRSKRRKGSRARKSRRRGNQYDYRQHLDALVARNGYICAICGNTIPANLPYPDPQSLSIDHVIPLARGGTHDIDNLQLTHLICNLRKGTKPARKR